MQASLEFSSMTIIVDAEENYPYYVNPIGPQYVIKTYYWQTIFTGVYNEILKTVKCLPMDLVSILFTGKHISKTQLSFFFHH